MRRHSGSVVSRSLGFATLGLEILAICVFGKEVAFQYRPWSPIDEGAHFHYVQVVAEKARLPFLLELISPDILAIDDGTYPAAPLKSAARSGLRGRSYEAFQPPLYYLFAAPVLAAVSGEDALVRVKVVRMLGVLLLLVAFLPLGGLAREVAGRDWPVAASFAGVAVVLPGILFRSAVVSNSVLEAPLVTTFVWMCFRAARRRSGRCFLGASLALALCLLTRLTLAFLVVPWAMAAGRLLSGRAGNAAGRQIALGLLVPLLALAPWFVHNWLRYGTLTANAQARAMQEMIVNPSGKNFTLRDAWESLGILGQFMLPQEWGGNSFSSAGYRASRFIGAALLVLPFLGLVSDMRGAPSWRVRSWRAMLLGSALGSGVVMLCVLSVSIDWPMIYPRYVQSALPSYCLVAFAGRPQRNMALWAVVALLMLLAVIGLWFDFLGHGLC